MANNIEPMIKLEPDGKASILSYNVPEPTSYSGRNFINLELDKSYFRKLDSFGTTTPTQSILEPEVGPQDYSKRILPISGVSYGSVISNISERPNYYFTLPSCVLSIGETGTNVIGNERISSKLSKLTMDDIIAANQVGKGLQVYRSMDGSLTYRFVDVDVISKRKADERSLPKEEYENISYTGPTVSISILVNIGHPYNESTISGPPTGIKIDVDGTAEVVSGLGHITKVEVEIGNAGYKQATPVSANDWSEWSFSDIITSPGRVSIKAKATHSSKLTKVSTHYINVVFNPISPTDTTPPILDIESPADGDFIIDPSGKFTVNITGTALDKDSGVKDVDIALDDDLSNYTHATPKAPGDWSTWKHSMPITTLGKHKITVRCQDKSNNTTIRSLTITTTTQPLVKNKLNRLLLVESYRLSSFFGSYGAGRTIKTFSLLPGEKTKISIKTYTREDKQFKEASSILDSFTQESADDFETATQAEQSHKQNYDESFKYSVRGEASASWGWGSAKIEGGVSGGTNAAREEFAKNISNATQKHTSKASAKRDVQVNTSYEVKQETGVETAIERTIENINVSRTLNFVFRQMNQEYITILHLVDVRIGLVQINEINGKDTTIYREVTLPQLSSLLNEVIVPSKVNEVRESIVHQLENIFDYKDEHHCFIEEKELKDKDTNPIKNTQYLRVKKECKSTYIGDVTGSQKSVPGIILAANKYVMRTEGVIVEALHGQGDALDAYSHGLQEEAVKAQQLKNAQIGAEVSKSHLAEKIVKDKDSDAAELYEQVYPCCPEQVVLPCLSTKVAENNNG